MAASTVKPNKDSTSTTSQSHEDQLLEKLRKDIRTLQFLNDETAFHENDYCKRLNRLLDVFKGHHSEYLDNARQWKRDKIGTFLTEKEPFRICAELLEKVVLTFKCQNTLMQHGTSICSKTISILGNHFSTNISGRLQSEDGWERRILDLLLEILRHQLLSTDAKIVERTFRLLANIIKSGRDPVTMSRIGLMEAMSAVLSKAEYLKYKIPIEKDQAVKAIIRFLRISLTKTEVKVKVNSLTVGGVLLVVRPLSWKSMNISPEDELEIMKIVQILVSDKLSAISREAINLLSQGGKRFLERMVQYYRHSNPRSDAEMTGLEILRSFVTSEVISAILLDIGLCEAIYIKLSQTEVPSFMQKHLELVELLHRTHLNWASVKLYSAPAFSNVCAVLLKVLNREDMQHFHTLIFYLYIKIPMFSLTLIYKEGLMDEVIRRIHKEIGKVSYLDLDKRLKFVMDSLLDVPGHTSNDIPGPTESINAVINANEFFVACPDVQPSNALKEDCPIPTIYEQELPDITENPTSEHAESKIGDVDVSEENLSQEIIFTDTLKGVFRIIRRLLDVPETKIEISSLLPTVLTVFFELGYRRKTYCEFIWDRESHSGSIGKATSPRTPQREIEKTVFIDIHFILARIFDDSSLLPTLVAKNVAIALYRMRLISEASTKLPENVSTLMDIIRSSASVKDWDLTFTATDLQRDAGLLLKRIHATMFLSLVAGSKPQSCPWFEASAKVLVKGLEDEHLTSDLMEKILLVLIKMTNDIEFDWKNMQSVLETNSLEPQRPLSSFLCGEDETADTSVCIVLKGGIELHVKADVLCRASPMFAPMTEGGRFRESEEGRIQLLDCSKEAFCQFLMSVEFDGSNKTVPIQEELPPLEILVELLVMTHRFMAFKLHTVTFNTILQKLSPTTFMNIFSILAEIPEFPCHIFGLDLLTTRSILFVYLFSTREIPQVDKFSILRELFFMDSQFVLDNIRKYFRMD